MTFVKGHTTWNKGKTTPQEVRLKQSIASARRGKAPWCAGKKCPQLSRKGETRNLPKGSAHQLWKGQEVGYRALHSWVSRIRGKAFFCEDCGLDQAPAFTKRGKPRSGKRSYFEWANISGHYLRILEDWKQLCKMCHATFDKSRIKV